MPARVEEAVAVPRPGLGEGREVGVEPGGDAHHVSFRAEEG